MKRIPLNNWQCLQENTETADGTDYGDLEKMNADMDSVSTLFTHTIIQYDKSKMSLAVCDE